MKYKPDIFYDLSHLSFDEKVGLLKYSKSICNDWWVDKLDCSESFGRQTIDMDFDEILEKCNESCIFNVIYRRGMEEWKDTKSIFRTQNWAIEVGFTTMESISYYLWIYIDENKLDEIIEKFNLKEQ